MTQKTKKILLSVISGILLMLVISGCGSDSTPTPVDQRKPGTDLPAADRAEKRGDIPATK